MQYTTPDKLHTNALGTRQTTSQAGCTGHGLLLNITAYWGGYVGEGTAQPQVADMI
jgi:hypothetical protein